MGALDDIPLSSRLECLDSWRGLVVLPLGVVTAGMLLGLWAAQAFVAGFGWIMGSHLAGVEFVNHLNAGEVLLGLGILGFFVRLWISDEHRLQTLLILCGLAELQAFVFACDVLGPLQTTLDWIRAPAILMIVPALYAALRLYAWGVSRKAGSGEETERGMDEP